MKAMNCNIQGSDSTHHCIFTLLFYHNSYGGNDRKLKISKYNCGIGVLCSEWKISSLRRAFPNPISRNLAQRHLNVADQDFIAHAHVQNHITCLREGKL